MFCLFSFFGDLNSSIDPVSFAFHHGKQYVPMFQVDPHKIDVLFSVNHRKMGKKTFLSWLRRLHTNLIGRYLTNDFCPECIFFSFFLMFLFSFWISVVFEPSLDLISILWLLGQHVGQFYFENKMNLIVQVCNILLQTNKKQKIKIPNTPST